MSITQDYIRKVVAKHTNDNHLYDYVIFTDGSAAPPARAKKLKVPAKWAYFFGDQDSRNCWGLVPREHTQTIGIGELLGIFNGLTKIYDDATAKNRDIATISALVISDSKYAISCCTAWKKKWIADNFIGSNLKPIKHRETLEKMYALIAKFKRVSFSHVRSHTSKPTDTNDINYELDYALWHGNNEVDNMMKAKMATFVDDTSESIAARKQLKRETTEIEVDLSSDTDQSISSKDYIESGQEMLKMEVENL
jgi:ribonuclease HI